MQAKLIIPLGAIIIPFLTGCVSHPTSLATVGPQPGQQPGHREHGSLQVFTATEKSIPSSGDDRYLFDLHTGYHIYDTDGKCVKYVPNHGSNADEWPDQVSLPAGSYNLLAQSTWCGLVTVPVVIQDGRATVVHLDNNWFPSSKTAPDQLVYLPNGEAAGWREATGSLQN